MFLVIRIPIWKMLLGDGSALQRIINVSCMIFFSLVFQILSATNVLEKSEILKYTFVIIPKN